MPDWSRREHPTRSRGVKLKQPQTKATAEWFYRRGLTGPSPRYSLRVLDLECGESHGHKRRERAAEGGDKGFDLSSRRNQ